MLFRANLLRNRDVHSDDFFLTCSQGTSLFLAQGGADALAKPRPGGGGGHFEVKEGHPDFLQIT